MVEADGGSRAGSAPAAPRPFVARHRPHLLALAAFVLLAVIHTWPLASRPNHYSRVDNGDYLLTLGRRGRELGEFWLPSGLFVGAGGELYVCDTYNHRVQVFEVRERYEPAS